MDLKANAENIIYGTAAVLGSAAVIGFTTGNSNLSPLTQIAVLLTGFSIFLLTAKKLSHPLDILSYGLSAIHYLAFTWLTVRTVQMNADQLFIFLGFTALALAGTANYIKNIEPKTKHLKLGIATVLIILIGLTAFDLSGAEPRYTTNLADQVTMNGRSPVKIGTMIVQNNFILPRKVEVPRYEACIYTDGERNHMYTYVDITERPALINGNSLKTSDIVIRGDENTTGDYTVRKAETCPNSLENNTIILTESEY